MKKLIYTKLFFPIVFLITWGPAIYLHDIGVNDGIIVSLYLAPFAVFLGFWVKSKFK